MDIYTSADNLVTLFALAIFAFGAAVYGSAIGIRAMYRRARRFRMPNVGGLIAYPSPAM